MDVRIRPSKLSGTIEAQPSKSDAHRRIIVASFSKGVSKVDNVVLSDDIKATIRGLGNSGSEFEIQSSEKFKDRVSLVITGSNGCAETDEKRIVNCGESGSTLRFLSMIYACCGGHTVFLGEGRLPRRSMQAAVDILKNHGISVEYPGNGVFLPMEIKGRLEGAEFRIDTNVTSQLLSGLLMGLSLNGRKGLVLAVGENESKGYVEMTVGILAEAGVDIKSGEKYEIRSAFIPKAMESKVEGDWSNASYFIAMKQMGADIDIEGLNENSIQPDSAAPVLFQRILSDGAIIDVSSCPDLMPALAVTAATSPGKKTITGGRRLREKESDRLKAVATGLKALDIWFEETEDGLVIQGGNIKGGKINSFNDHRIAMAFSSLCVVSEGDIVINGAECVNKSYPLFFEDLKKIGGGIE